MTTPLVLIEEIYQQFEAAHLFYGHGTDNAWDEALALVFYALSIPSEAEETFFQRELSAFEMKKIRDLAQQRINTKKPLAYLTHKAYFFGLPFYVDERVLIPRSPIAELIEHQFTPWIDYERVHNILDLCTGSGCIAIACAYGFENSHIDAVDIDPHALDVAKINCEALEVTDQVTLIQSNLFRELPKKMYDIIVSNPPYVSVEEMKTLPEEYHHEPELALQAEDEGIALVIEMMREAVKYLSEHGILVIEVGNSQEALERRFPHIPFVWLEFERGGEGVFLLTKQDLMGIARYAPTNS